MKRLSIPIALDYAFGMSMAELARREGISVQRIQQKLSGVSYALYADISARMLRINPNRTARLIHSKVTPKLYGDRAETPEEFFYELQREEKTFNFDCSTGATSVQYHHDESGC